MREGWEYKKLGEVATFINGYPFKPSDWKDSGRKIIRIQNLNNPDAVYNYYDGDIDTKFIISKGDVLISWSGSLGVYEWSDEEAILNQHIFKVVFNKGEINKRFFEYVVSSRINEMKMKVHGITMQHITKRDFDIIPIPVPPLSEQQRIVSELDLLSSIIEKKKAQLIEYDQLAQSIFYDMFGDPVANEKGWEVKKLGEIALVKTGPFGSMLHKEDYIHNGIPLINPIHMKDFHIIADMDFTISDEKAEELDKYILQTDDVIFARRGDIGRCAVVTEKENGYLCGTGSLFVRFVVEVASTYIMFIIRSSSFTNELVSNAKGATMLNLNSSIIEGLKLPLPPLPLQQSFASKIEAIERQKALIQQSIAEVQMLFDSRMDDWFA